MPVNRTPRIADERSYEDDYDEYRPSAMLPELKENADYTFRWCRARMGRDADAKNIDYHVREGRAPVPWDERNDVFVNPVMFAAVPKPASGHIEFGDHILMRWSRRRGESRKRYYENITKRQLAGAGKLSKDFNQDERYAKVSGESRLRFGPDSANH